MRNVQLSVSSNRASKRGLADVSKVLYAKPLNELVAELKEDCCEIAPRPFTALLDDHEEVEITAVLERTAVYWYPPTKGDPEKYLANQARIRVDPRQVMVAEWPQRQQSAQVGRSTAVASASERRGTAQAGGRKRTSYLG